MSLDVIDIWEEYLKYVQKENIRYFKNKNE